MTIRKTGGSMLPRSAPDVVLSGGRGPHGSMLLRRLAVVVTVVAVLVGMGGVSVSLSHGVSFGGVSPAAADVPAPGETWTARTASDETSSWYSVAYGNGVFVAVARTGTNRVMTSPDGVTWTTRTAAVQSGWYAVTYGNGLFVAVSENAVMTSPDGVTWTARTSAIACDECEVRVTFGNGVFVAVASGGTNRVMTSTDGVTWTARTAPLSGWRSVTYGNGVFVAVASNGTDLVMTSTDDGVTWTARTAAKANGWRSVTYGNGVFVAVANSGTDLVMTSTDNGETWTARSAADPMTSWISVTYGDGVFVAVALSSAGGVLVMTSPDGVTWTARSAAEANIWRWVTFGNGLFVAVSSNGTNRVMTSGSLRSAPAAPTSLVATVGDGSASIAFTAGAEGDAAITKYQVKVGAGAWTDVVGTTSPFTVTGLTNYQISRIRLRAVSSAGDGAASDPVKVWPRVTGSALSFLKAQSASRILASVSAFSPVDGAVSHYWFTAYAKGTNTAVARCRATAAVGSCVFTGLLANTEYDVSARGFFRLTGSPAVVLPTLDSAKQTVRTKS